MPEWTTHRIPFADHWRSLQDPRIAGLFDIDAYERALLANFTRDPDSGKHYCDADYCDQGVFYPDDCKPDDNGIFPPCAVLLAEYPGMIGITYFISNNNPV